MCIAEEMILISANLLPSSQFKGRYQARPAMGKTSPSKWPEWVVHLIVLPDDDEETFISKKVWLELVSSAFVLGVILLIISLVNHFHALSVLTSAFVAFFLLAGILSLRVKKHIQVFFYVSEVFKILFSFCVVVITGGILQSGGLVLIGMAGIFFALVFPKPEKVWFLLILYLGTLAAEALLQPYLVPLVRFSPSQNLLFFVLTLTLVVLTMFSFLHTFFRERTRFRQLETEKLRALDAAKSHFFTNISHEFRTPLTVIMGMADEVPEEPGRLIRRNSKKLLRLVDQLLDLSRLEAGSINAHYVQAEVVGEMKYLLESFHSLAKGKQVELHFSSDFDELWMDIDTEKLENIVSNLLDNAIKYTPEGGLASIHLERVEDNRLLIRVKDTGIGIPEAEQEKVFNRFYRVGEWQVEGAGIGLTIVREFVKLLDGEIALDSREGHGTTFSIWLPIRHETPRQLAGRQAAKAENNRADLRKIAVNGKPQLLIVEDNSDLVHYLENLLRKEYQLSAAPDGEEGIRMAVEQVPDIIISDIMMPKKNGIEVCQTLKNDIRTNHIPIILLTAKADIASRITGLEAGADAYLAKPFNRKELEVELARLIRLRALLREKFSQSALHASNGQPASLNERFLQDVRTCLDKHYPDETFGIHALHTMLGMSRTQLHRKLVALTGLPASHFIRAFRLEKARQLLRTTRMTVAEVAYAVGFQDPQYFSRAFSHEFGLPPTEARESW
jgi:signal transduction histidine kinase/CheY-like chemotaxis protein